MPEKKLSFFDAIRHRRYISCPHSFPFLFSTCCIQEGKASFTVFHLVEHVGEGVALFFSFFSAGMRGAFFHDLPSRGEGYGPFFPLFFLFLVWGLKVRCRRPLCQSSRGTGTTLPFFLSFPRKMERGGPVFFQGWILLPLPGQDRMSSAVGWWKGLIVL